MSEMPQGVVGQKNPAELAQEFAQEMYSKGYISKEVDELATFVAEKLRTIALAAVMARSPLQPSRQRLRQGRV